MKKQIAKAILLIVTCQGEGGQFTFKASYLPGENNINTALRIRNHFIDTVIRKIEEEQSK